MVARSRYWVVLVSLALALGMSSSAWPQVGPVVGTVSVYDPSTPYVISCTPTSWRVRGDGDAALDPGEVVRLDIEVKNEGAEVIDSLTGFLGSSSPDVVPHYPNCYTPGEDEGVRYSAPLNPGSSTVNFDPFVVFLSQGIECMDRVEFTLNLHYTIFGDPTTKYLNHTFSLPLRSTNKPLHVTGEQEFIPSLDSKQYPVAAVSDRDLVVFYNQSGSGATFARFDLSLRLVEGPRLLGGSGLTTQGTASALYNPYKGGGTTELYYTSWDGFKVVVAQGGSIETVLDASGHGPVSVALNSNAQEVGILRANGTSPFNLFLERRTAGTNTLMYSQPLGLGTDSIYGDGFCYLAYLPPSGGSGDGAYYAAWEEHQGMTHLLHIEKRNGQTLQQEGSWTSPLQSTLSRPTLAVDIASRQVGMAWAAQAGSAPPKSEIHFQLFFEDLSPASFPPEVVSSSPTDTDAIAPGLAFHPSGYYLSWNERNQLSGISGRIKVGFLQGAPYSRTITRYTASQEWYNPLTPTPVAASDRLLVVWADQRSSLALPSSLHSVTAIPLHNEMPYNLDFLDDELISQPFKNAHHATVVSKGGEFLVGWRYSEPGSTDAGRIFVSTFAADGTPIIDKMMISPWGSPPPDQPMYADPVSLVHQGDYHVFWVGPSNTLWRWVENQGGGAATQFALEDSNGRLLGAAEMSGYMQAEEVLLVKDTRGSDLVPNLYLANPAYPIPPTRVSDLASGSIGGASVAYSPSNQRWVVAWTDTSPSYTLRVAFFDPGLVQDGATLTLDSSHTAFNSSAEVSVAANASRVLILRPTDLDYSGWTGVLRVWHLDPSGGVICTDDLISGMSTNNFPAYSTQIRLDQDQFLVSHAYRGPSYLAMENIHYFFRQVLDASGSRVNWPMLAGSFRVRMAWNFTYETCTTTSGGAAVYMNDGASGLSGNIFLANLGWVPSDLQCAVFNEPPSVAHGGPYSAQFGTNVTLNGSVTDPDYGDSLSVMGWDLNQDGVVDVGSPSTTLTPLQLVAYGISQPMSRAITVKGIDSQGASTERITTLTIVDTTSPSVSVTAPNGGETLRAGDVVTVTWDGTDNYQIQKWDVYFCTNYTDDGNPANETWQPVALALSPATHSVGWAVPEQLSATCRLKVVGTDASPAHNAGSDISNGNFYIVQVTTTAVRTLVLWNSLRTEALYAGQSGALLSKLTELAAHSKVSGVLLDLNNVAGLPALYASWDGTPCDSAANRSANVVAANAVADAIRDYVISQVTSTYTNAQYLVLAGDDRVIPFRRVADGTATYPESQYAGSVNISTPVGAAVDRSFTLTDGTFGDPAYDSTEAGAGFIALPDLATGRLVESPAEMAETVNGFIAQDGQVGLNKVLVTGYDFLDDSAGAIADAFAAAGKAADRRITPPDTWTSADLEALIFSAPPHALHNLNDHSDHRTIGTPSGLLTAAQMDGHAGAPLRGTMFYSVGCHSGLSVPDDLGLNPLDLPQVMMRKGVSAYVGNTGFGWGLRYGSGYSEKLMELITARLLGQPSYALGQALNDAKRDYFLQDHRYDVFDEKVLFQSALYGLPMYQVVVTAPSKARDELAGADGPDAQSADGITLVKGRRDAGAPGERGETLPPGVTELTLNFDFGPGTYSTVTTGAGTYYKLNGKASAEVGDVIQPLFTYDSRLSGTVSHGVMFTGGSYSVESGFDPVVGAPASNNPPLGEGNIGPAMGSYIPTVSRTSTTVTSGLAGRAPEGVTTELSRMTVTTGYYEDGLESRFDQMTFVGYYSNSADKVAPDVAGPGPLHALDGLTVHFSAAVSDASGVYRVLVTYTDSQGTWESLDLAHNAGSGHWEGSLALKRDISYYVQAVDSAGNVGVLRTTGPDLDGSGQPTGSTYSGAKLFDVTLADGDADGLPDAWETPNGLNPADGTGVNGAAGDPDLDGYTNAEEFAGDTDPQDADSDGDGDNDGSEAHRGRDPLGPSDGKRIFITATKVGDDVRIDWPAGNPDNAVIDGPYWVYRSTDPFFGPGEERNTPPGIPTGTQTYLDAGGGAGPTYYYTVTNARYTAPPPAVDVVSPGTGPAAGGTSVSVYGTGFASGAKVTFGGIQATVVVFVNSTKITCKTPAGTAGAQDVKVTNPNGQFGTLTGGFTYY